MYRLFRKRRYFIITFLLLAVSLGILGGQRYLFIENLERLALDWRMQGLQQDDEKTEIVVILGREESLNELGSWPWPRTIHSMLLRKLTNARLVVLDILFPEPSTPRADTELAQTTHDAGNVITAMHIAPSEHHALGIPVPPFAAMAEAVRGIGTTNVDKDIDGLIRFHTPVRIQDDSAYPSLPLAAAMELTGETPELLESEEGMHLVLGKRILPLDQDGNMPVIFSRSPFPTYEYTDVLRGAIPLDTFDNKVILVGIAASGADDFHVVPDGFAKQVLTGVQYNALALETILTGHVPSRQSPLSSTLVIIFLVLLGGLVALPRHPAIGALGLLLVIVLSCATNVLVFRQHLLWVDLAFPLLALVTAYIFASFFKYIILHRDWRLKSYSLSSLYSLEGASRNHKSLGDFLEQVWPQFKAGSGVDLIIPQGSLEDMTEDVRHAVQEDMQTSGGQHRVIILRSSDRDHSMKMALPIPPRDSSGEPTYTLLGWKGRLADDTSRTLAVTILSAAWFYRTLSRSRERRKLLTETISAIFRALDFRDPITGGHSDRVAALSMDILDEMDIDDESREDIHLGALIHDIGKIGIPDAVLGKPDKLTGEEFGLILKHPTIGNEIMKTVSLPTESKRTMYEHHERFDGSGYPKGISGDNLSLGGRIVAVADVFDALLSDRPYRKGLSLGEVCDYISSGSGTKYDPQVVDILLRLKAPKDWEPGRRPPAIKGEPKRES